MSVTGQHSCGVSVRWPWRYTDLHLTRNNQLNHSTHWSTRFTLCCTRVQWRCHATTINRYHNHWYFSSNFCASIHKHYAHKYLCRKKVCHSNKYICTIQEWHSASEYGTCSVCLGVNWWQMALLQQKDGLPDPRGSLASTVALQTIAQVN